MRKLTDRHLAALSIVAMSLVVGFSTRRQIPVTTAPQKQGATAARADAGQPKLTVAAKQLNDRERPTIY
ncbi:MAG: hypothetical protein NXI04_08050 [Planctomycetaceae bacterium]|nr:hypothetical protein [Planctomycetaceae bacterium]